jgi:hypothetical protein
MKWLPLVLFALATPSASAEKQHLTFVTSAGPIGFLSIEQTGNVIETEWHVDDYGRGSKLKEHLELGADGLPRRWDIVGKGWFGAPVRESFVVKGGKARWTSLDDKGEGDAKNALYIPSNATPSVQQLYLRVLLGAKDQMHAALPGGTLRLEKLHDVEIGTAKGQGHGLRDLGARPHAVLPPRARRPSSGDALSGLGVGRRRARRRLRGALGAGRVALSGDRHI